MRGKKSQSWSVDVVIACIIFIGAFFAFYALLNKSTTPNLADLRDDASILIREIASPEAPLRVVDNNELNITKINDMKNLTYDELKRRLRINSDFCIFLENENGELILLNNSYRGVGAPTISLNGTPCDQY